MSLRAAAFSAALLAGLAGCDGCKNGGKAAASTDAGTDAALSAVSSVTGATTEAGTPSAPRDKTLLAVADGSSDVKLVRTFDDRIVIVSGSLPYEAKANGTLAPLVTSAALASLYPDDDTFVGFLDSSTSVQWVRGELDPPGRLFIDGFQGRSRKTFAVRDGKLSATTPPFDARHVVKWKGKLLGASFTAKPNEVAWLEDKSEPAPRPVAKLQNVTALAVDAEGALYVMALSPYEKIRAAVYPSTWKPEDAPAIIEGEQAADCSLVTSFDASVVVRCVRNAPGFGDGTKFFAAKASGFERVFPDAPAQTGSASIGKDGALYVTSPKKLVVERCPKTGSCSPVEIKTELGSFATAQYEHDVSDVVERKGEFDIGDRSWSTIKIETTASKDALFGTFSVIARDENDVWVFASIYRGGVLFHSTDDPSRERTHLPSQFDGRFLAKNASPPQLWTGHCEQVFVRLSSDDAKRGADIEKVLVSKSLAYDAPYHWWVVEGRLHEDKVSGVVVVRRDVEEPLDKMERTVEKLVDTFTPNPMSKPKVYCTLPVLDRVVHQSKP